MSHFNSAFYFKVFSHKRRESCMGKALLCLIKRLYSTRAGPLSLSKMHRGQGVVVYKSSQSPPIALSPLFLSICSLFFFFIFQCPFPAKAGGKNSCLDFAELKAGGSHTCARTSAGEVYCWGRNDDYGQLGIGTTGGEYGTPQKVKGVGGVGFLSGAVELSAGLNHTCARISAGEVYCWGRNHRGQLGIGTTGGTWIQALNATVGGTLY